MKKQILFLTFGLIVSLANLNPGKFSNFAKIACLHSLQNRRNTPPPKVLILHREGGDIILKEGESIIAQVEDYDSECYVRTNVIIHKIHSEHYIEVIFKGIPRAIFTKDIIS